MGGEVVLLLTGSINTFAKKFTVVNDKTQRKREYVEAINYYLGKFNLPVVFVENSGEDISSLFSSQINAGRLEILTFNGNDYPADIGKGLGEFNCIEYGLKHSKLIKENSFVFKVTGRYKLKNLAKYIKDFDKNPAMDLMADLTNNFHLSHSSIFGFRPFFIKRYLKKHQGLLNDTAGWYFECILAKAVLEAIADRVKFQLIRYYPIIGGISGSDGYKYKKSFFHIFPRQMKYSLRYFIWKR